MAEPTVTQAQQPKKGVSTFLIILLIVLFVGGGIGAWWMLRPKDDEVEEEITEPDEKGADGRNDASNQYVGLDEDQVNFLFGTGGLTGQTPEDDKPGGKNNPYYINDTYAQGLIDSVAQQMQSHTETMDLIRAKYDIGISMIGRDSDERTAIKDLFGKLPNTDLTGPKYYLSFPVYGTNEPDGANYRNDLQNLVNAGWEGLNLTNLRDPSQPWWLPNIKLNLLVGTTSSATPSTHKTWASTAPREELNFFKGFNGHWVADQMLSDRFVDKNNPQQMVSIHNPNARAAFAAGHMFTFAQNWIEEIDRLDKVTRWEALRKLMASKEVGGEGLSFTFVDPNDPNVTYYGLYNINTKKPDTSPIFDPPKI